MKRYFKLYKSFLKTSLVAESQYRTNLFLLLLTSFGWGLIYIFLYVFIFNHLDQVGDWTYERALVLSATILLVRAVTSLLFNLNLRIFPQLIYYGYLDYILLKPISSQFYASLKRFYLRPFVRFILGWLILLVIIVQNKIQINPFYFLTYLFLIFTSVIIVYCLWFMTCCSIFWLGNLENISEFFPIVTRIATLPLDILPGVLKEIVFFVIPLVFIATIPAKSLFGLVSWQAVLYGVFIAGLLLFLSHKLWNFGLRRYSSVSS